MQKLRSDMGIGDNIRRLRKANHFTQEYVVSQLQLMDCSLSVMTYSKIERNLYNIRISELLALKVLFGVDFSEFFKDLPLPQLPSSPAD